MSIKTDRPGLLLVQMLSIEDDAAFFDLQNENVAFWKEFGNSIDASIEEVTKRRLKNGNNRFGIWLNDELLGIVGYSTKDHPKEAEVGILLAKNATGHGYAQSAIRAITTFAKPRYDRVFAEVEPTNQPSIQLMKRAGYQTNGRIVERDWGKALVFET